MSFRFSLAAVLLLREIEEEREERALTQILRQIGETREAILAIESQLQELAHERESSVGSMQLARSLREAEETRNSLQAVRIAREQQLSKLEEQRLQQIARYQQAHRARKMLTEMREAQQTRWHAERLRREQSTADDVFLSRRSRRQ
jgi:flagellar export protein FliJ